MNHERPTQESTLIGWTVRQPTAVERAHIRAVTGCDDSTIRNVFATLAGRNAPRRPSDVSFMRVIDGAKRVGLIVRLDALAETA